MKHLVGHTSNGVPVHVDLIGSQAAKRIAQQPRLLALAKEMLEQITVQDAEIYIEHNMGRLIGYNFIVKTTDKDTILYARLLRDDIYTRFVRNGKPLSTHFLTARLKRDDNNSYELSDIWVGRINPPRPGSTDETSESKSYWSNHALILDNQPIQLQTVTKECPY